MQECELDAWLGDFADEVADEQRASLRRASDMIDARYPDPDERDTAGTGAFTAAAQVILGDGTLASLAAAYLAARRAERDAMAALTGAIIAADETMSESAIAATAGVTRMTVRKALGK